jgi:hypothetical protein
MALSPLNLSNEPSESESLSPALLEKTVDEVACELLDALFPRAGGTIWKAPVILKFKVTKKRMLFLNVNRTFLNRSIRTSLFTASIIKQLCQLPF